MTVAEMRRRVSNQEFLEWTRYRAVKHQREELEGKKAKRRAKRKR